MELSFNFTPINTQLGGRKNRLIWRIDPQLGQVFNTLLDKVLNKDQQNILVDPGSISYGAYLDGQVPVNGKAVNTFYAYRFKGLNEKGQPVFYGAESENAVELEEKYRLMNLESIFREVMVEAGRREPVIQGGVSNYVAYGPWSLNIMLTYSVGNKIRLLEIASGNYGTYRPSAQQNLRKEFVNRWRYPGDESNTAIPGLAPEGVPIRWWTPSLNFASDIYQMYDDSDIRIVSGDYLRLQSAALNYTCSPELCRYMRLKAARLSLTGSNLFTWAHKELRGQDPTQSGSSPNINLGLRPVYVFALNISF